MSWIEKNGLAVILARLRSLANPEFHEDVIWWGDISMTNLQAQVLADTIITVDRLQEAKANNRLSAELIRVYLSESTVETFDITGKLPEYEDTIPLEKV